MPFPGLAWLGGGVLLVEADEQVGQLTADRLDPEQRGQLRQVDQPVRIPAGPVVIAPSTIRKTRWWGLACLVQQAAELLQDCCHPVFHDSKSRDHQASGGPVSRTNGQVVAAAYAGGGVNPPMRPASARANAITVRSCR